MRARPGTCSARWNFSDRPDEIRVALAAIAFGLCYTGVIVTLVTTWANSYLYSYGFAVAFISGYMLWTTSGKLGTLDLVPDHLFGVPVTLAGIAMLAVGHLGALVSLQQVSLLVTLAGFILMLFGRRVFHLTRVPLLYLLLAMPIWDPCSSGLGLQARCYQARLPSACCTRSVCQPSRRAP